MTRFSFVVDPIRFRTLAAFDHMLFEGREKVKILFPLCGKVIDMKYYYDLGHTVYGVECAPEAITDFFTEQKLKYVKKEMPNARGHVYSSLNGRLKIFNANFLDFTE
jgi:thiopurine S-methyltransferase